MGENWWRRKILFITKTHKHWKQRFPGIILHPHSSVPHHSLFSQLLFLVFMEKHEKGHTGSSIFTHPCSCPLSHTLIQNVCVLSFSAKHCSRFSLPLVFSIHTCSLNIIERNFSASLLTRILCSTRYFAFLFSFMDGGGKNPSTRNL